MKSDTPKSKRVEYSADMLDFLRRVLTLLIEKKKKLVVKKPPKHSLSQQRVERQERLMQKPLKSICLEVGQSFFLDFIGKSPDKLLRPEWNTYSVCVGSEENELLFRWIYSEVHELEDADVQWGRLISLLWTKYHLKTLTTWTLLQSSDVMFASMILPLPLLSQWFGLYHHPEKGLYQEDLIVDIVENFFRYPDDLIQHQIAA